MEDPVEGRISPNHEQAKVSQEQLKKWVETGFDENAVAVCGTSIEVLNQALQIGAIPRWKDAIEKPPPRLSLIGDYRYAYYANPIIGNLSRINPNLADELKRPAPVYGPVESSKNYAQMNALCDGFYDATGIFIEVHNLATIANLVLPKQYSRAVHKVIDAVTEVEEDVDAAEKILEKTTGGMDRSKVIKALEFCIERRGVLLFFNRKLLNHVVEPDPENYEGLIILTKNLLSVDSISGIQILSGADTEALQINTLQRE